MPAVEEIDGHNACKKAQRSTERRGSERVQRENSMGGAAFKRRRRCGFGGRDQ